nr:MAG TPA: hypothetical protein [Caudoviricetes sp.]
MTSKKEWHQGMKCTAVSRRTGRPCGSYAVKGAVVCRKHGGSAPQIKKAAKLNYARYIVQEKVRREVGALAVDVPIESRVTDPLIELQRLTTEAIHFKDVLGKMVNELKDIERITTDGAVQIRAAVQLYGEAMDRTAKFLDMAMKHDIAGKIVQIEAAKVSAISAAISRALASAGLSSEQESTVRNTLAIELHALESQEG